MAGKEAEIFGPTAGGSTYCSHCDKRVAILAGKSLLEINAYMRANPGSCIMIGGRLNLKT
jgi:hypothetical protein